MANEIKFIEIEDGITLEVSATGEFLLDCAEILIEEIEKNSGVDFDIMMCMHQGEKIKYVCDES